MSLLLAGELECSLQDVRSSGGGVASELTDLLADASVQFDSAGWCDADRIRREAEAVLRRIGEDEAISIATPEGFAYYALHPLDYADLTAKANICSNNAMVFGIRSIGTTLGAVVAAKLRSLKFNAHRTTVRPQGHPYDRFCEFDFSQRQQIRMALSRNAWFLVCDEGPGRSGSSLLSVAEALEREHVPADQILVLCSHEPHLPTLCAPDAVRRWSRYRVLASGLTRRIPLEAGEDLSGGKWRQKFCDREEPWPAAWTQLERLKYLSNDSRQLLKFEGHAQYGQEVRCRNHALADSGFSPPYCGNLEGFGKHTLQVGSTGRASEVSAEVLSRIAEYCAFRSREFAVSEANSTELQIMANVNHQREFGSPLEEALPVDRPVIADGRMQPHKWLHTAKGHWLKLDGATHGSDHFFPGPCDIAWDVAGAVVEWNLDSSAREYFLSEYTRLSGDRIRSRIESYEAAYAIFRLAWSKTAAAAMQNTSEEIRLMRDYRRYRDAVKCRFQRALS